MDKYIFFYDESFLDSKITQKKETELNFEAKDLSEIFCSVTIGIKEKCLKNFEVDYLNFENEIKKIHNIKHSDTEIKGTLFSKKYFNNGVASFNKNMTEIYSKLFDIIEKNHIKVHINLLNKTEIMLSDIFKIDKLDNRILYQLFKFISNYKGKKIVPILFKDNLSAEDFIDQFQEFLNNIYQEIIYSKKKEMEIGTIEELFNYINNEKILGFKNEYNWKFSKPFELIFDYIINRLKLSNDKIDIYVDGNGSERDLSYNSAKNFKIGTVKSLNSKKSMGIRCADLLSNLIGRLTKNIVEKLTIDWDEKESRKYIKEKRLLNDEWFSLDEKKLELCKNIFNFFSSKNTHIDSGIFFDSRVFLKSYFSYVGFHSMFCKNNKLKNQYMNNEEYNTFLLVSLETEYYNNFISYLGNNKIRSLGHNLMKDLLKRGIYEISTKARACEVYQMCFMEIIDSKIFFIRIE